MASVPDADPPYDAVVFDCDSTLSTIEGIDELALHSPHAAEIAALTERAMAGEVPLEDVYALRLELLRPDRAALDALGERYVETRLPRCAELVAALRELGKIVWIVSGGLAPAVRRLASELGVGPGNVRAVEVELDESGAWAGFDSTSPLARAGGKIEVAREIAAACSEPGFCMVGDGVTDLETAPPARRFVAFGGVVRRERVFAAARAHCERADFGALVPLLLAPQEIERLRASPGHASLLAETPRP